MNPTSPFDAVKVVRKAGSAPANPTDGTARLHRHGDDRRRHGARERHALLLRGLGEARPDVSRAARLAATPGIGSRRRRHEPAGDARRRARSTSRGRTRRALRPDPRRPQGGLAARRPDRRQDDRQRHGATVGRHRARRTARSTTTRSGRSAAASSRARCAASAKPGRPPPAPVTNLVASPGDRRVDLTWTNPTGLFDTITVVRKAGRAARQPDGRHRRLPGQRGARSPTPG